MYTVWHFDYTVVQVSLLYIQDCNLEGLPKSSQVALLNFKIEITQCLMKEYKFAGKKWARQSMPVKTMLHLCLSVTIQTIFQCLLQTRAGANFPDASIAMKFDGFFLYTF